MHRIYYILFSLSLLCMPGLLPAQDVPVDLVTGAPAVNIPLYTVMDGDVSASIGLSYSTNGMKVSKYQQSGNAGLGWSLYAGGSIYREVRGLPDDYLGTGTDTRKGWLHSTLPSELQSFVSTDNTTCAQESMNYDKLNTWFTSLADTEPDVFYFQCNGYSGKFMLDNDKQWQVIPYQDVKVEFNAQAKYFILTTGDGMTFNFSTVSTTNQQSALMPNASGVSYFKTDYEYYKVALNYISSWQLTEAVSGSGKKITYSYDPAQYSSEEIPVRYAEYGTTPIMKQQYKMKYATSSRRLNSIKADQTEVLFTWGSKYISQIKVYNHANKVNPFLKEYNFGYAGSSNLGTAYLRKIVEQSADCVIMPPYVFDYYGADLVKTGKSLLPMEDSHKKDYWGYFNENTTSEIPTLYVYDNRNSGNRYRIEPIPGEAPTSVLGVNGNTRSANPNTAHAGMLDRVTYPGGGQTTFLYELCDYFDAVAGTTFKGGGVRVKQVNIHDGQSFKNNIIKEFDYSEANGQSSGRLLYTPAFAVTADNTIIASEDDMAPESGVIYGRVGVRSPGAGKVVYTADMESVYPLPTGQATKTSYAIRAFYDRDGVISCQSAGNVKVDYYAYPYAVNGDYTYKRGQTKKVQYYEEEVPGTPAALPVKEEEYVYTDLTHGNITYIKGLKYESIGRLYVYGFYTIMARSSKVLSQQTTHLASETDKSKKLTTTTAYTYEGVGDSKLLSLVQSTDSEGRVHKNTIKYSGDYMARLTNPNPSSVMDMALKAMKDLGAKNIPVEQTSSVLANGKPEKVLSASLTLFQPLGARQTFPLGPLGLSNFGPAAVYQLGRSTLTASDISTGSYTSFTYDEQNYLLSMRMGYDASFKQVINQEDTWGNKSASHYGYDKTLPVAVITNAEAQQVVYEGFEPGGNTGYSFGIVGTATGWTGEKALSTSANVSINKAGIIYSGAPAYRFLCRVQSGAAGSITVELFQSGTRKAVGTVNYPAGGAWRLAELTLAATELTNADFELRVKTSTAAVIDDVVFFPSSATVNTYTYLPGIGQKSATDTRGTTMFYQYDQLGRLTHVIDQDKNIRERKSYSLATVAKPMITANFSGPQSCNEGVPVTFTGYNSPCLTGLQHKWYINDQEISGENTTALPYTFPTMGTYVVRHEVTHDGMTESFKSKIIVEGPVITVSIVNSGAPLYTCSTLNRERILKAVVNGCNTGLIYKWEESSIYDNYYSWKTVGTNSDTFITEGNPNLTRYRCIVIQGCGGPEATSDVVSIQHEKFCEGQL